MSGDPLNLSGVWHGQFSYTSGQQPASFTASLLERNALVDGDTEEVGAVGAARGETLTAQVQGRRTGQEITFLKLYDGAFDEYDAVQYVGEISDDGSEILGRWSIPGEGSGEFMMIRSGHDPLAALRVAHAAI
jgi:hypothetical protein